MKNIYLIDGTMGAGKTTTCQILKNKLPNCVFLDGDWCWDMHPFQVTPETKKLETENCLVHTIQRIWQLWQINLELRKVFSIEIRQ